ncbi:unnamed protein product [Cuscuta epithymum]|uniref:Uncharacterized protein n=1 Tax=Cuscuta epithymum TaxID=186058 RepID=A0AAV0C6D9_9ASTE|nr:unnamed protein product [Cuscuta epithymum]
MVGLHGGLEDRDARTRSFGIPRWCRSRRRSHATVLRRVFHSSTGGSCFTVAAQGEGFPGAGLECLFHRSSGPRLARAWVSEMAVTGGYFCLSPEYSFCSGESALVLELYERRVSLFSNGLASCLVRN